MVSLGFRVHRKRDDFLDVQGNDAVNVSPNLLSTMKEKILRLEDLSRRLEPTAQERASVRRKVVNYSEEFLAGLEEEKAYNANSDGGAALLQSPISDEPADIDNLIDLLHENVDFPALNPASGGHMGYIPGGGLYYSALGDYLVDIFNRYVGIYSAGPGAVRMENMLIRWMAEIVGFPKDSVGNLTTGGSLAHLVAIVTARDAKQIRSTDVEHSVVYVSEQHHQSLGKALRIAGLRESMHADKKSESECYLHPIPVDENYRMKPDELEKQIKLDKQKLKPFLVVATAGTTDYGVVDPLKEIGEVCLRQGLWYHVDAAYGGFFMLTQEGKEKLRGIELADSVTMDPHKGLFLPYGLGVVLVKDKNAVFDSFHHEADYIPDSKNDPEPSPADYSPELTKHFRGLRMWLPLKLHGVAPFRACLEEKLLLAKYFYAEIKKRGFEVGPAPDLSVVYYRYVPEGIADDPAKLKNFNQDLMNAVNMDGRVYISFSEWGKKYVLRFACLSFRTHLKHVDLLLELLEGKVAALEKSYRFDTVS